MLKQIKNKSGFTMIELMVVTAIASVLAVTAVPDLLKIMDNLSLKSAARDLYTAMQETRLQAIKNNSSAAIVFDSVNNRYYLCDDKGIDDKWNGANDLLGIGNNTITRTVDLSDYENRVQFGSGNVPAGKQISGSALPDDGIGYQYKFMSMNSQGVGTAGYVYLENIKTGDAYAVGTRSSGLIRLLKWDGGEWK